jgi:methionyl aminopeptidase
LITLKSDSELEALREAGRVSAEILDEVSKIIKPGVSTLALNEFVHEQTIKKGAIPAPLNYKGFPKSVCTSVNNVVCHGIPTAKQKLVEGDIINVDVTSIVDGFHGDTSRMYFVGQKISEKAKRIVRCSQECLFLGIATVKPGSRIGDIGAAIQAHASSQEFSVVREFVGHGIGRTFHEDPQIPHYGEKGKGARLKEGMVFTIEPMINEGHWKTKILKDGWTAITIDGGLSAQWEHTIGITSQGEVRILTESALEIKQRPNLQ